MSEITAKDWGKAKYRSGGRGRGRGRRGRGPAELGGAWRRDTGSDDEEADEEGEGHAHGSDDDMQFRCGACVMSRTKPCMQAMTQPQCCVWGPA